MVVFAGGTNVDDVGDVALESRKITGLNGGDGGTTEMPGKGVDVFVGREERSEHVSSSSSSTKVKNIMEFDLISGGPNFISHPLFNFGPAVDK